MQTECVVVGGGVVGLAVARALRRFGSFTEVLVLEKERTIGSGTSSRNSEVIHSGIYYDHSTLPLKAKFCVEGRQMMYNFCDEHNVPYNKCGKLVVAANTDEIQTLHNLKLRGEQNNVTGLEIIDTKTAQSIANSAELQCAAALWSPETGILSSHEFMEALVTDGEFDISFGSTATKITSLTSSGSNSPNFKVSVAIAGSDQLEEIECKHVVNCAGLFADNLTDHTPKMKFAKGSYFRLVNQPPPFTTLVYPVPPSSYNLGGLGVHYTIDMSGNAKFGPDVEWVDNPNVNLDVEKDRSNAFYASVRRYWPNLQDGSLEPDYAGVRPKLSGQGEGAADFGFFDDGTPGLIHLMGIESPGLTSSLALGQYVSDQLKKKI